MRLTDAERRNAAEEYIRAAREHFAELQILAADGVRHYPLAFYVGGVSVECLFRAYSTLVNAPFDDKHDLRKIATNARFFDFVSGEEAQQEELEAALAEIYVRWSNSFRYCSAAGLRGKLEQKGLEKYEGRRLSGDILKPNWNVLYDSVDKIMTTGLGRWEHSKQKWNR
jgi:hypothetical protein